MHSEITTSTDQGNNTLSEDTSEDSTFTRIMTWFIAGTSVVIVFYCLHMGNLFVTGWHYASLQQKISNEIAADSSFEEIVYDKRFQPLLSHNDSALNQIENLLHLVRENRFRRALQRLQSSRFPNIPQKQSITNDLNTLVELISKSEQPKQDSSIEEQESDTQSNPKVEIVKNNIMTKTKNSILSLAMPRIDPKVKITYDTLRELAKQKGFELPTLRV